jgi:hypothetical protein
MALWWQHLGRGGSEFLPNSHPQVHTGALPRRSAAEQSTPVDLGTGKRQWTEQEARLATTGGRREIEAAVLWRK